MWYNLRRIDNHFLQQAVVEDILRDRYKERSSEGLEEHGHGRAGGDVLERKHRLDSDQALLHAEADTKAVDHLIAEPLAMASGCLEGGEESGANGTENHREVVERDIVPDNCGANAADNVG